MGYQAPRGGCTVLVGEKQILRFGPFQLDTQCGQLRRDGVGLKLQGQPVKILEILLGSPGQLVTREELRDRLWASHTFVDFDHSLNTAIKKLREALGDEAGKPQYIETLPKRGYRFIGKIAAEDRLNMVSAAASPATKDVFGKIATTLADAAIKAETRSRIRARGLRVVALLLVSLVGIGTFGYWISRPVPVPHVVGTRVLTRTGYPKDFLVKPLSDRRALYVFEKRPKGWITLQVPLNGGDVSEFHSVGWLSDISKDGLKFLSSFGSTEPPGASFDNGPTDTWMQTLPGNEARLVLKNSNWPIWYGEDSILFLQNNPAEMYRANLDGTGLERISTEPKMLAPHVSPDRKRIRFVSGPPSIRVWELDADGHQLHPAVDDRKAVMGGSWTPDGSWYFYTRWDGLQGSIWAASENREWWSKSIPLQQITFGPLSFGVPAVSSDGKQLYAAGRQSRGQLSVYDTRLEMFVPYLSGISACYTDFTRDGQSVAYVSYPEGTLWRSRIDGSERRQLTVPPIAVVNPRWSPDGGLIVFTDFSNGDRREIDENTPRHIYVMSADGGVPILITAGPPNPVDPGWSPDGNSIMYAGGSNDSALTEIQILNLRTQKLTTVPGSKGLWSPRWSPDGSHLIALSPGYPSNKLMMFTFSSGKWDELAVGGPFDWPSWSHDSRFAFAKEGERLVRIAISSRQREILTSLRGFRSTHFLDRFGSGWYGLTPDDRPITTLDTGIEEVYAFDLEYK